MRLAALVLLGLLLVRSGGLKLRRRTAFMAVVRTWRLFSLRTTRMVSYGLPIGEITTGSLTMALAAMSPVWSITELAGYGILTGMFMLLLSGQLVVWRRNPQASCGCTGRLRSPVGLRSAGRAALLVALSVSGLLLASVTATLEWISASGVETTVVVSFAGREGDGDTVYQTRSRLRLDDGSMLFERWRETDGRRLVLRFEPLPAGRTVEAVVLSHVSLADSELMQAQPHSAAHFEPVGTFTLQAPDGAVSRSPSREREVAASAPYGRGELIINRVVASGDQLVIHGRITGYSREELHLELVLGTPELTLPDGGEATWIGTRIGFDPDHPGIFEMQFTGVAALEGEAELVQGSVSSPGPESPSAALAFPMP